MLLFVTVWFPICFTLESQNLTVQLTLLPLSGIGVLFALVHQDKVPLSIALADYNPLTDEWRDVSTSSLTRLQNVSAHLDLHLLPVCSLFWFLWGTWSLPAPLRSCVTANVTTSKWPSQATRPHFWLMAKLEGLKTWKFPLTSSHIPALLSEASQVTSSFHQRHSYKSRHQLNKAA